MHLLLVDGSTFGSGASTQQDNGEMIVTLAADDMLMVVNHTGFSDTDLQTNAGGIHPNVNASIVIQQIA